MNRDAASSVEWGGRHMRGTILILGLVVAATAVMIVAFSRVGPVDAPGGPAASQPDVPDDTTRERRVRVRPPKASKPARRPPRPLPAGPPDDPAAERGLPPAAARAARARPADEGETRRTGEFVDGKRHGVWITKFPNGGRRETHYVHGVRHGAEEAWHPDGKRKLRGEYREGKMHGTWTVWRRDGSRESERTYWMDEQNGPVRYFRADGRMEEEYFFERGRETAGRARFAR